MKGVSELKLVDYKVIKTYFELNQQFKSLNGVINIHPTFNRTIIKIDDSHYNIKLSVEITSKTNQEPVPFDVEIVIMSMFEFGNWEDVSRVQIAINNATAILFPYLRTLLSTVTMNGNVPPYCLPIMNVTKLFGEIPVISQ